jgi:Ca2+:H+ antiporter
MTAVRNLSWSAVAPVLAVLCLPLTWGRALPAVMVVVVALLLGGAVLAAVQHAEVVAHRVGEPFGSLVLAVAVTVIEVGLIVSLMLAGGPETSTLARDTVFAAVMITCNGIVGLSILLGAIRHQLVSFNMEGTASALATVATLATLTMVFPTFTTSEPGPEFSPEQLAFAAIASLVLYLLFVATQAGAHRDFFLPVDEDGDGVLDEEHADPPSTRTAVVSLLLLVLSLVAVVGLAKVLSPSIKSAVDAAGAPESFVGVVIALLVLLPESLAAARSALRNRLQVSLNLAYGSGMASIGLTIPVLAVATIWIDTPLELGLGSTQIILLVLTVVVGGLTVLPGRSHKLQGGLHLVILSAFLFLALAP